MTIKTRMIDYTWQGKTFQGELAFDDTADTARPGILIAHNWAGRSPQDGLVAQRLAAAGFTAFALDMYGKGILGTSREENAANMQTLLDDRRELHARLRCALDTLNAQPESDAEKSAIIGYCFGGLCALDAARVGIPILASVSFHGLFNRPADLPVEPISASVLMLHGWDDPMATPDDVLSVSRELSEAGADWQLHAYGNTMHAFTSPAANDPENGTVYDATADARSWSAALAFLHEQLGD